MDFSTAPAASRRVIRLYDLLLGDEDARVCADIPEAACNDQPANFFLSLASYFCSKVADQLASASLVLPWLLGVVGAPPFMIGLLVPIREAGALLPQLFFAAYIRNFAIRKWFWVAGSVGQALCVFGMLGAGLALNGVVGAFAIMALLVLFSQARGVSSVASKDVLGKTISKRRRGSMMGYASALAGAAAAAVGVWFGVQANQPLGQWAVFALLAGAGVLWLAGALVYAFILEQPGATAGGGNAIREGLGSLALLKNDRPFRAFVIARALLLGIPLSVPFYVALAREQTGGNLAGLAMMLVASGLAGSLSAPIWGRLADRSSRQVMVISSVLAGALGIAVFVAVRIGLSLADSPALYASLFFALGVAHSGARLGRKTHLVDMASADQRAAYVAVSNTAIGALLLVGGAFGALAQLLGTDSAILTLSLICVLAARKAGALADVQRHSPAA